MKKKNCSSKEGAIFNEPRRFVSNRGNGLCNYTTKLTFKKQFQTTKSEVKQINLTTVLVEFLTKRLIRCTIL